MSFTSIFTIIYGILVIIGGIIGYAAAASIPSLVMGSGFGIVIAASGLGMLYRQKWGFPLALLSVFILTIFFSYRFILTMKPMPAGVMLALSLIMISLLLKKLK